MIGGWKNSLIDFANKQASSFAKATDDKKA